VTARIDPGNTGAVPAWLTPGGAEAFSQPWLGILGFSRTAWAAGAHRVVSTYAIPAGQDPWQGIYSGPPGSTDLTPRLAWFDLSSTAAPALVQNGTTATYTNITLTDALVANAGTSFGFIATAGDTRGAESPAWSHNSSTIVYASTNMGKDGRLAGIVGGPVAGTSDLYTVPYNGGAGGSATPLAGAAESAWDEFYPAFSPDDAFVAYARVPNADGIRYYAPNSEVYVVQPERADVAAVRGRRRDDRLRWTNDVPRHLRVEPAHQQHQLPGRHHEPPGPGQPHALVGRRRDSCARASAAPAAAGMTRSPEPARAAAPRV
jgi:hypothetical protein